LFYNFSGLSNKLKQNKCWGRERFSGERERERERDIFRRDPAENPSRDGWLARERERDLTARSGRDFVEREIILREEQRERRERGGEGEDRFMEKRNGCFEFVFLLIS
jgi:hypothetical protein